MGTNVYPGRARIDPDAPETIGICGRCGSLWNLRDLQYQYQWAGQKLQNTFLLVCENCMDVPNENLRTIILPPDPPPVYNVRVPNFAIMERNEYGLSAAAPGTRMFAAASSMSADLTVA